MRGDRAARRRLGPHRGEPIALAALASSSKRWIERCPCRRDGGKPPPVAHRLDRQRFGERASPDDPEIDVVVGERVAAHHVPQEALRGVLPLVEVVDVGLLASEPVTDQHIAPQQLAEPEVAHPHEAARRTIVGAIARLLAAEHLDRRGHHGPPVGEVADRPDEARRPCDSCALERAGGPGVTHHHRHPERSGTLDRRTRAGRVRSQPHGARASGAVPTAVEPT